MWCGEEPPWPWRPCTCPARGCFHWIQEAECAAGNSHVRAFIEFPVWAFILTLKQYPSYRDVARPESDNECEMPEHRVCVSMSPFMSFFPRRLYLEERSGEGEHWGSRAPGDGWLLRKMFWGLPIEPENDLYHLGTREQGQGWRSFPRAAVTKCHKPAGWKEQRFILTVTAARSPKSRHQEAMLPLKPARPPSLPLPSFLWFAGRLWCSLPCRSSQGPAPVWCLSLCLNFPFL